MDTSVFAVDTEANTSSSNGKRRGSWITVPFILATMAGLSIGSAGWQANLIVYLIEKFNIKSIDAAQISNVVSGGVNLFPLLGAIIADSFLGSFSVIAMSSIISVLGTAALTLTAAIDSLRPKPCETGSSLCQTPSKFQYAILYLGLIVACIGCGGTRFCLSTLGANQFDKAEDREFFFNWFFFTMYTSYAISFTAMVYVQDNVSWGLGFGLCLAATFIGLVVFLLGSHFYRRDKPQGSPFTALARVVVASIRKWKTPLSSRIEDYYFHDEPKPNQISVLISNSLLRFFSRAALKAEGDVTPEDGSIAKPWRLCTVEQVKDFKALLRILPVWSTSIFLSTPIVMQFSITVLQALTMDRHLGPHFKIPAGSIYVIVLLSTCISLTLVDRFFHPLWRKIMRKSPSPFQIIGVGHVLALLSMVVSALVEARRLRIVHDHQQDIEANSVVPMLALWLFPQLIIVGISEAFYLPGQVSLYYQEFPASLRTTSTAMMSLIFGIAYYISTALTDLVRRQTDWLTDNINHGRIDNVYWLLAVIGGVNFCYFLCCAKLYKFQNVEKVVPENSSASGSKN